MDLRSFSQRIGALGLTLILCVTAPNSVEPARAQDGPAIMNWRLSLPQQSTARNRPSTAYRARARPRLAPARYQDDSELGLNMPPLRVQTPLIADQAAPRIAIVGDSLAEALVLGVEGDVGTRTSYNLVHKTSSASGLVRDDYFHWPRTIVSMLQEHRDLAVLVIMVGLNDRQAIRIGEVSHEPLSEAWREEYKRRIDAILTSAREAKVPIIWVGMPIMRLPRLSADLAAISFLIRERVDIFGQTFVETADAFTDATGAFAASGPDVMGDIVRLRGADGIHFTPAGQRKLAFFVDRPLRRLALNRPSLSPLPVPAVAATPQPGLPIPPVAPELVLPSLTLREPVILIPARPAIGERRVLGEIQQSSQFLSAGRAEFADPTSRNLFDRGLSPDARPGRADDHGWR
jgi:hypothetical protein